MSLQFQIDVLRRQYRSGDTSARDTLLRLLQTYLLLMIRRAARPQNADSRIAGVIRRVAGQRPASDAGRDSQSLPSADVFCRRLCDELLQAPGENVQVERVFETIRTAQRATACFA